LATITFFLELTHYYDNGSFRWDRGYVYITVVANISVTISMYFLVLFYECTSDVLKPYKPLAKFFCIKSVIFFSFWQGVTIAVLAKLGIIQGKTEWTLENVEAGTQNFMICIEMLFCALAFNYAFGLKSYKASNHHPLLEVQQMVDIRQNFTYLSTNFAPIARNFADVANVKDVISDIDASFAKSPKKTCCSWQFSHSNRIGTKEAHNNGGELEKTIFRCSASLE